MGDLYAYTNLCYVHRVSWDGAVSAPGAKGWRVCTADGRARQASHMEDSHEDRSPVNAFR